MTYLVPHPLDSAADQVGEYLPLDETWAVTAPGDYHAGAVLAIHKATGNSRALVAITIPARLNHTDELVTIRLLIDPEDVTGIAEAISGAARWIRSCRDVGYDPDHPERGRS